MQGRNVAGRTSLIIRDAALRAALQERSATVKQIAACFRVSANTIKHYRHIFRRAQRLAGDVKTATKPIVSSKNIGKKPAKITKPQRAKKQPSIKPVARTPPATMIKHNKAVVARAAVVKAAARTVRTGPRVLTSAPVALFSGKAVSVHARKIARQQSQKQREEEYYGIEMFL